MRDLSKFEFLNLLGIWLFQRVSNLEVFPSFRIRANRGKHNIEKDIPFYQFPAKADPSVRLSPFCFPSAQSRDSDRNNNYPSPPHLYPFVSSFEQDTFSLRPTCRRPKLPILGSVAAFLSTFLFSSNSLSLAIFPPRKKERKRERWKWKWIIAQASIVFDRINIFNRSVGGGNILR